MVLIAGCGGSGSSPSTGHEASGVSADTLSGAPLAGGALSANGLIAQADAICSRADREIAVVTPAGLDAREVASVAPADAVIEQTAVSELDRLNPPAQMAGDWRRIVAYRRTLLSLIHISEPTRPY